MNKPYDVVFIEDHMGVVLPSFCCKVSKKLPVALPDLSEQQAQSERYSENIARNKRF